MATAVAGALAPDLPADVLLDVKDLTVAYRARRPGGAARRGASRFQLGRGEALGLAGESGCGKTTTALALLGLLPTNLYRALGARSCSTRPTASCSIHKRTERGMQQVRWARISMVFQGAMNSLDPVMRVVRPDRRGDPRCTSRRSTGRASTTDRRAVRATSASARPGPASTRTSSPAACASAS